MGQVGGGPVINPDGNGNDNQNPNQNLNQVPNQVPDQNPPPLNLFLPNALVAPGALPRPQ